MASIRWKNRRLLLPLFLFLLTSIYLAEALQLRPQFDEGLVGPKFLPVLASILMYAALAVVVWQDLRQGPPDEPLGSLATPALVALATAVYILVFRMAGYALATTLYAFALLCLFQLEEGGLLRRALYAVAITAVFYALFELGFGVRLPLIRVWQA